VEAARVDAGASDTVKVKLTSLAGGTGPGDEREAASVAAASGAVVAGDRLEELIPALSAQAIVVLGDRLSANGADSGPEKLVEAGDCKPDGSEELPFDLYCVHGRIIPARAT
jgi:hypothetical protein